MPGIFYLYDETGKFARWNYNFEKVSGYNTDEISKMSPLDFYDGDEKPLIRKKIDTAFRRGMAEVEAHFLTKTKNKIPYYFNGWSAEFEGTKCLIGMGIDITERKKGEAQLKLLESVITNTTDSVLITEAEPIDGDGPRIVYVNEAFVKMTGYSKKEVIGKTPRILQGPDSDRAELDRLRRALEKWEACEIETINYKKNGEAFWVNFAVAPVANEKGWFTHFISIERDITERKKVEEDIKIKNTELQRLSGYLQNVREEERKHLAREVHDELGQLASALKIDVDWLGLKMTDMDENAHKRIAHANKTIEVLIVSIRKIASSMRPSVLDDFGLNTAIQWQCREFENLNGIECIFVSDLNETELPIEINTELFRITQESLTNVMRHSKADKVEVKITEDEEKIFLTIADNGKGFDTTKKKKTLGLIGLRERAVSLNGELNIQSKVGNGTTVTAIIPKKHIS